MERTSCSNVLVCQLRSAHEVLSTGGTSCSNVLVCQPRSAHEVLSTGGTSCSNVLVCQLRSAHEVPSTGVLIITLIEGLLIDHGNPAHDT